MNRRRLLVLLFALVFCLAACGNDDDGGQSSVDDELEGRTFLAEQVTEDGEERALVTDTMLRIEFTSGEVRANAGCNHLSGPIESTDDGVLTVGGMGGTEMGCSAELHAQDDWIIELFTSSPAWSLDDDRLVLTTDTTEIVLLDRRVADPDRALDGTVWRIDSLVDGTGPDGSVSQYPSDDAWIRLADGRLEGYTGCNSLSGDYTLDDDALVVDQLVLTDVFCGEELGRAEEQIATVLRRAEVAVEARSLWLTGDDAGLGLRADGD